MSDSSDVYNTLKTPAQAPKGKKATAYSEAFHHLKSTEQC